MTELENMIYKTALGIIPELRSIVKEDLTDAKFISIPFYCEGCLDNIIYDRSKKMFVKIKYTIGKGAGEWPLGTALSQFSAYYDDVEFREFDISES